MSGHPSPTEKKSENRSTNARQLPLKGVGAPENAGAEKKADPFPINPDFWDNLLDSLPPWLDEILAIALLIFGILSFLALFNSSDAVVAVAWANILTSLFGAGSLIVSAALFLLGIVLLLPKAGISIKFPPYRILALEISFLAVLAMLHLLQGDTELRALARAGAGGGHIGWGLSFPVYSLLGRSGALIVFGTVLAMSLVIVAGIRKTHLQSRLQFISKRLTQFANQTLKDPIIGNPVIEPPGADPTLQIDLSAAANRRRVPIMRIRPDADQIRPSLRTSDSPVSAPPPPSTLPRNAVDTRVVIEAGQITPVEIEREIKFDYDAIGKVKSKNKDGQMMVERPDGRLKRYFTVASMREPRKPLKRDKSLPALTMLQDLPLNVPEEDEINRNVVLIENTLLEFDIDVDVVDVQVGPTVTQYAVQPFRDSGKDGDGTLERTRVNKIASLANDLALSLSAKRLRMETPVAGRMYMGIEVPNKVPSIVALRSVYESKDFAEKVEKSSSPLLVPLGRDVAGKPVVVDIAQMPHLLIAGTTGSGKSVCIAALAAALILNNMPDQVKLVMMDPKMVELSRYNGLPHLIGPVETDMERIIEVLRWCTREMDRRYKLLEEHAARNIEIYNNRQASRRRGGEPLPYIVILVDEIGDLMMSRPEETEKTVTRLAQMARAVGMHLVVATQRPSVDVITGLIKANFPTRISFAVASGVDSRVILDTVGAETLLGRGDMLYLATDASGPKRVQGCYVSDDEVRQIVDYWRDWHKKQIADGKSEAIHTGPWERGLTRREFLAETDPMLEEAIALVVEAGEASASLIQRRLGLGYPRAARIMDMLEELGVIGESVGGGRNRRVLIPRGQDPFKKLIDKRMKN